MAEPNIIYKITILTMLDKVDFQLSNTQISNFFLENDYTDYFTIQQTLADLSGAQLIREEYTHNNTHYSITDTGRETLNILQDKITPGILEDIELFFQKNKIKYKNENSILSNYYKSMPTGFDVRCQIKEKGNSILDLTLHVQDVIQAQAICKNWQDRYMDVYAYLADNLIC